MQLSQQNQELTEKLKTRKKNHTSHVCLVQLFSTSCRRGSVQKSQRFSSPEPQTEEFCFALQRRNVWKLTRDASLSLRWVGEPVSFGKLLFEEGRKHTREHFLLRRLKGRVGGWTPLLWVIRPLKGSYWTQAQRVGAHSTLSLYSRNCRSSFLFVFFFIGCKCIHSCVPCKGPFATSTLIDSTDKEFFCVQNSKRDFASRDVCCCLNKLVNAETL